MCSPFEDCIAKSGMLPLSKNHEIYEVQPLPMEIINGGTNTGYVITYPSDVTDVQIKNQIHNTDHSRNNYTPW